MSRRKAGLSPSLFPFLAVLVCTLGTLILLLALVAQEARDATVAHAKQTKAAEQNQLASIQSAAKKDELPEAALETPDSPQLTSDTASRLIDEEQFRMEQLVSFRDAQTQDAETKRDMVAQLESAIRDLKARLESLKQEVATATSNLDPEEELKVDESTLVMMQDEIAKLRAEIKELESNERGKKPRVVIVPHRGPNGTQRRPVYVECTEDEIRIMPEGARITKTQALAAAESKNPNANPLGSALRVARRHAMQAYGDQVAPYPLLIVRPGGIRMFHIASALMKDWDDQYGYELVPGEVDLAFPGGDNVLRKDLDYAIHEASSRNFVFARGMGGGRGNGTGGGDGQYDGGPPQSATGNAISGDSPYSNSPSANGNSMANAKPKKPLPILSAKNLDQQALKNGFTPARDQRFANAFGTYQPPPGSSGQSYGANGAISSQSDALNNFLEGRHSANPDTRASNGSKNGASGTGPMSDSVSGLTAGESNPGQSGTDDSGVENSDVATSGEEGDLSAPQGQLVGGTQNSPAAGNRGTMPQQVTTGQSASGQMAAGQTAATSMPMMQTSTTPNESAPSNQSSQIEQSVNASANGAASQSSNPVRREGRDWAMPQAFRGMGGTEVVRPISMICHHDRYELLDQGRLVATFPFQRGDVYQPTIELATAVRDRVSNWGATLPGGRWQPRLDVQIGPHAEQRFHQLETLMQGSGIEIHRDSYRSTP